MQKTEVVDWVAWRVAAGLTVARCDLKECAYGGLKEGIQDVKWKR